MITTTPYTYTKLRKAFTGTRAECRAVLDIVIDDFMPFPRRDIVELTRGNNRIGYYRPARGQYINDKIYTLHWNNDGTVSLFL